MTVLKRFKGSILRDGMMGAELEHVVLATEHDALVQQMRTSLDAVTFNLDKTDKTALALEKRLGEAHDHIRSLQLSPVAKCTLCGSTELSWSTFNKSSDTVPEGRLRTNEVSCQFVLGCDHCSETLAVINADTVAERLSGARGPKDNAQKPPSADAIRLDEAKALLKRVEQADALSHDCGLWKDISSFLSESPQSAPTAPQNYSRILRLLGLEAGADPVVAVHTLVRIADGLYDALQPIGSDHRRCPTTLITNVINMRDNGMKDRELATRYLFLRSAAAASPVTLPQDRWLIVSRPGIDGALTGDALDLAVVTAMAAKCYTYDPADGPLLCFEVGDQDWVAAQNPDQARAVLVEQSGGWLSCDADDLEVSLASEATLDRKWFDEDAPHEPAGTLREWLAQSTEPCWLNGTE